MRNKNVLRAGSFADGTIVAVGSRTFGTSTVITTGQVNAADRPIYELTSATIDGLAYNTIVYTTQSGATLAAFDFTPYSGARIIAINTKTGEFKSNTATSGSGAGIVLTYKKADLTPLFNQVLLYPVEVVTLAGYRYNAQYYGIYDQLVAWADTNNLMVYAATDDDVDNTDSDFQDLIEAIRADNFQTLGAKLVTPADDLTAAYAAQQAASPPNGSLKNQPAPRGISYATDLPYTRAQYGDEVDPSADTFHELGVNVITLDGGAMVHSSDRAMTDYADATDVLYGGVRRTLNATMALVDSKVGAVLTSSPTSALYDLEGLAAIRGAIVAGLNEAVTRRYIAALSEDEPAYNLNFPELADTDETDRKKRLLEEIFIELRINNVVHVVNFRWEVAQ